MVFFDVFWLPFRLRRRLLKFPETADEIDDSESFLIQGQDGYEYEAWFYINGVATNEEMARDRGKYLVAVFGRPVRIIQNQTRSLLPDLLQVTAQKGFQSLTGAGSRALEAINNSLLDNGCKRVIVLAHSQGAVIMGRVLSLLDNDSSLPDSALRKLEVFTFGNPPDYMFSERPLGHIEHFANRFDLVARLGELAEDAMKRGKIRIDGTVLRLRHSLQ